MLALAKQLFFAIFIAFKLQIQYNRHKLWQTFLALCTMYRVSLLLLFAFLLRKKLQFFVPWIRTQDCIYVVDICCTKYVHSTYIALVLRHLILMVKRPQVLAAISLCSDYTHCTARVVFFIFSIIWSDFRSWIGKKIVKA